MIDPAPAAPVPRPCEDRGSQATGTVELPSRRGGNLVFRSSISPATDGALKNPCVIASTAGRPVSLENCGLAASTLHPQTFCRVLMQAAYQDNFFVRSPHGGPPPDPPVFDRRPAVLTF